METPNMFNWKTKITYNNFKVDWHLLIGLEQVLRWNDFPDGYCGEFIVDKSSKDINCCKAGRYNVTELRVMSMVDSKIPNIAEWSPFYVSFPLIAYSNAFSKLPYKDRELIFDCPCYSMKWQKKNRRTMIITELSLLNPHLLISAEEEFKKAEEIRKKIQNDLKNKL